MWHSLSEDTQDYWIQPTIQTLDNPTAIEFMKHSVNKYHPIKIKNAVNHWKALEKWNKEYLIETLGSKQININLTPDGYGDCIKYISDSDAMLESQQDKLQTHMKTLGQQTSSLKATSIGTIEGNSNHDDGLKPYFVYPAEVNMDIREFYELLESKSSTVVPYLSYQNDNIRTCISELLDDIDPSLPLGDEVFGSSTVDDDDTVALEAINLWIGDERSVSSLHKDHFENMYVVVSGEKTFTLLPPTDIAFLPEIECRTLKYHLQSSSPTNNQKQPEVVGETIDNDVHVKTTLASTNLVLSNKECPTDTISWIALDPNDYIHTNNGSNHHYLSSKNNKCPEYMYPMFKFAHPIQCKVKAGEILYIPAMWYHRVSQTCLTISVNYWYEQSFDFRFIFYQTIQRIKEQHEEPDKKETNEKTL